jgi:hypothetical protein
MSVMAKERVVTYRRRQAARTLDDPALDSVGTAEKIILL